MKKIQNFFSYAKVSELPTNQIFELFDLSNNGKDVSPYKIDYAVNKDILDECQLGAYESLIELNNEVALLYDNGLYFCGWLWCYISFICCKRV